MPHQKKDRRLYKKNGKPREKWYYDACALEASKNIWGELYNGKSDRRAFVSHLSVGEAYCKSALKGKEVKNTFLRVFKDATEQFKCLEVVGNDVDDSLFDGIRTEFSRLKVADAMHLATAITYECRVFRTTDGDLKNIPSEKIKKFAAKYNIADFVITSK